MEDINVGQEINVEEEISSEPIKSVPTSTASNTIDLTEGSDVNIPLSKKKKAYKISSPVWADFERICDKEGKVESAICKHCKIKLKCPSTQGTSTLTRHLSLCKYNPTKRAKGQQMLSFTTSSSDGSGNLSNWKFDQEACKRAMARMIILDELPFKFVEKEGFREFCKVVQPLIKNISRTTIVKEVYKIYKLERAKLQKLFRESIHRVSLTTDLWTSNQNIGYLCLTAHFVDSSWKLHKHIINFCILPSPHTGEAISSAIESCLDAWKIRQVCAITVDNASSNDVALNNLRTNLRMKDGLLGDGNSLHVRCIAHILNLVVREGTDEIKDCIARIRNSVKWVKSSPSREQAFERSCEMVRISTKMSLCLDVSTRWNSTYLMLKHALPFEKAFKRLASDSDAFRSTTPPFEEDWNYARVLCDFLGVFFEITEMLSGTKYVTSSLHFRYIDKIQDALNSFSAVQTDPLLLRMCNKMKEKLRKYWGSVDKFNIYLLIAFVLDPRYKLDYLHWCLKRVLPIDDASAIARKIYDTMVALYEMYKVEASCACSSSQGSVSTFASSMTAIDDKKYEEYIREKEQSSFDCSMTEVDAYLKDLQERAVEPFDILAWWSTATKYKILACMARDILAIPVSTVASESAFSAGGRVLDQYRSSLTPMLVECLICTQDWLRAAPKDPDYEEMIDHLDKCAKEEAESISITSSSLPPISLKD